MITTLADLVRNDKAWLHTRAEQLAAALQSSGKDGGSHLTEFCRAAATWWQVGSSPEERTSRWRWIETVANRFLSSLGAEGFRLLAADISTLADQVHFLTVLAESSVPLLLRLAVELVAERLAREVPTDDASADISWNRMFCALLSLAGGTASRAACLAAVIDRAPLWLLGESFRMLGTLEHYDNFYSELADALAVASNPALPHAIARSLISGASLRLGEQISLIAKKAEKESTALDLLVAVEHELFRAGATAALRARYTAFWTSWRDYKHSTPRLISAYLNARPANHEDVFDFLTRDGSRQRGSVRPTWGMRGIMFTTASSMRASLRERMPGEEPVPIHGLPSPDFDGGGVLTSLTPDAASLLVQTQRDPIFALQYLALFVRHSQFAEIAAQVVSDATCIARWSSVHGQAAASVWSRLTELSFYTDRLHNTRDAVLRRLLTRLPTEAISRLGVDRSDKLSSELRQLVGQRLADARTLREAENVIQAGEHLHFFTPDEMLALLDIPSLATDTETCDDKQSYRIATLSRILDGYPWLGQPIVDAIAIDRLSEILANEPQFGPSDHASCHCDTSLALKTRLVRCLAAAEPKQAIDLLTALRERDIRMIFQARLDLLSSDEYGPRVPSAAMQWLDLVNELEPKLTLAYLGSMVVSADVMRDPNEPLTIEQVIPWISDWLGRHDLEAHDELWGLLEERIDRCAAAGDLPGVARLAQVILPGPHQQLRAYRKRAVALISAAPESSLVGRDFRRFRDRLQNEDPDLLAAFPYPFR